MNVFVSSIILAALAVASAPAQDQQAKEEEELQRSLAEAGPSSIDFSRALENHLAKYPDSAHRAELERALVKAAIENKDDRRIVLYGERVLAREPGDLQLLDRVSRSLLASSDKDPSERALKYAKRYEEELRKLGQQKPPDGAGAARWREEIDRSLARALVLQSRATGNLGRVPDAIELARKSYDAFASAEGAREIARWLARAGQNEEAVRRYADAFTIPDSRTRDSDRVADRIHMGELYRKLKGSETGLGDLLLEAFDRTTALVAVRQLRLRALDPNAMASKPLEFTVSSVDGGKLPLASLKGKVVILDFWATWCGPCRMQHPLYDTVKKHFEDRQDVVFLSINTDEERDGVPGFLADNKWERKNVYYEDGLSAALQIDSIPVAVLLNKKGDVESRMSFIPGRFVEMLTGRIQQILNGE
jgi:thiol-disulfide isomerase/thioredoxin